MTQVEQNVKDSWLYKLLRKVAKYAAQRNIKRITQFNKICENFDFIDEQWYLDFKDELNKLSIDSDREDTEKQ